MRRFYNNGTSFLETITKGAANLTPAGAITNTVKKIVKAKKDKDSRNPDPKTPKMNSDKKTKKETKKETKKDEITDKQVKEYYEKKEKYIPKKRVKNLQELEPLKPIKGGGFAPIGEPRAFNKGGRVNRKFGGGADMGSKKLSTKQMKIAKLAGNKKKIDGPDFKKLRAMKSPISKSIRKA